MADIDPLVQEITHEPGDAIESKAEDNLTPDQAMELLNSPKLKLLVYILINLMYNFNTVFVGAIPFLLDQPKFQCLEGTAYQDCDKEKACSPGQIYRFDFDKCYDTFVIALGLECGEYNGKLQLLAICAFASNWGGSFLFNVLGDKYGRLKISRYGFVLSCGLYLLYLLPFTYGLLVTYMLLFGFLTSYFLQAYILGVEFTSSENRDFYVIVS